MAKRTFHSLMILALTLQATVALAEPAAKDVSERAQMYNDSLFDSGAPSEYLDSEIKPAPGKIRKLLTVLPGVLYRGGGPGGKKPLDEKNLMALCEAGFSLAVYGYTENFKKVDPIECTNNVTGKPNTLRYISGDAPSKEFKPVFLQEIRQIIMDPSKGPAFVHCWNGLHASGELAAIALRQFCGWEGETASNYWLRHAGGFKLISRINKYTPVDSLNIPGDIQDALCKQDQ